VRQAKTEESHRQERRVGRPRSSGTCSRAFQTAAGGVRCVGQAKTEESHRQQRRVGRPRPKGTCSRTFQTAAGRVRCLWAGQRPKSPTRNSGERGARAKAAKALLEYPRGPNAEGQYLGIGMKPAHRFSGSHQRRRPSRSGSPRKSTAAVFRLVGCWRAAGRRKPHLLGDQSKRGVILSGMAAAFSCVPFLGTRRHGVEESLCGFASRFCVAVRASAHWIGRAPTASQRRERFFTAWRPRFEDETRRKSWPPLRSE
jgi:hypothetical protein